MARYSRAPIIDNDTEYYKPLRSKRGVKNIVQYGTPMLYNPTIVDRSMLSTTAHIWTYGDRFYKLAHQYYGDGEFWWVIAWYNGKPTEVDISPGYVIEIPLDIEEALTILGV